MLKLIKYLIYLILYNISFYSCDSELVIQSNSNQLFTVNGNQILKNNSPFFENGVNTLNTFGISNTELYSSWQIKVVREFIGNLREQPITGFTIQDSNDSFLHPLQEVVNSNRSQNIITILCPFGWVFPDGSQQLFTGLNPSEQIFYEEYKQKMKAIAIQFKNQPDVWIEVWNEPYHFNNENNYSHNLWLNDHIDMIDNLREIDGFSNIILVQGNEQGQSENAILAKGHELLLNRENIIFDLHAYEKWLINSNSEQINDRIQELKNQNLAFIFGEIGVINANGLMPVNDFLMSAKLNKITTLAWLFNRNSNDQNSLLTDEGLENNTNNLNWGSNFKNFLTQ